jgi:hypothetical protein
MLKKYNIEHYVTNNQEIKASHVERLQKTIKEKMFRYFTHHGTHKYTDVLDSLIHSYNNSIHSSLGIPPNKVNGSNQEKLWQKQFNPDKPLEQYTQPKFTVGDRVRISKYSTIFSKGYLPNWSEEIFTVGEVHKTKPIVYSLKDDSETTLDGTWYEPELQKVVVTDNTYKIEAILGQRRLNGKVQYLVRWAGYPKSFDSYVNKADIVQNYKN